MSKMTFGKEAAESYDARFARIQPFKDTLYLSSRLAMAGLRENARVLCVGAGTGAEILYLAAEFPDWTFTVVEPSEPMMNLCREKTSEAGLEGRCAYHLGFLNTLPQVDSHDAATAFLVSHFITEREQRLEFYRQIADNLLEGGLLVSAALCHAEEDHPSLMKTWEDMLIYAGMDRPGLEQYRAELESKVSLLSDSQERELLALSGFREARSFLKLLLIHAWVARKGAH